MLDGLLLVDKPPGMTSHDVVQLVRQKLGLRRIGHTGTLDPMAQGLLVLLVGPATSCQQALQGHEKVYDAVLQLGVQTDTADAQGTPIRTAAVPPLEQRQVAEVLAACCGTNLQTPPAYSAVKVRGRPAYWWARRHQPIPLSARTIHIFSITLLEYEEDAITFRVHCSAGTYIRVLGQTIAEHLGTVGHLTRLVRLSIGTWRLEDAHPVSWIRDATPQALSTQLLRLPPDLARGPSQPPRLQGSEAGFI